MKAAVYQRNACSGPESEAALAGQRTLMENYACAHGAEIVAWYTDAAVNGLLPLEQRPAGAALLKAAAAAEFAVVLVPSLDRVGRTDALVRGSAAQLARVGVKLESVSEGEVR